VAVQKYKFPLALPNQFLEIRLLTLCQTSSILLFVNLDISYHSQFPVLQTVATYCGNDDTMNVRNSGRRRLDVAIVALPRSVPCYA